MLLAIDIGNTNVTLGVFKTVRAGAGTSERGARLPDRSWRLATASGATADEYGIKLLDLLHYSQIEQGAITAVAIASVVPVLTSVFLELSQRYFNIRAFVIDENTRLPIRNLYDNPKEVGADRLVNASAAYARFGGPCMVVDFGTATTFDCVNGRAEYAGGIIVPGPALSAESLALHTAKLPKVSIAKPERLVGKSTIESIQSGLYYGYLKLVDGLVEKLIDELGRSTQVVATGGLAGLLAVDSKYIRPDQIFPDLTLEGICLLYERNR